jgi:hypothetical protein
MIEVFAGKVQKTGFFQKPGFPGISERISAEFLTPSGQARH